MSSLSTTLPPFVLKTFQHQYIEWDKSRTKSTQLNYKIDGTDIKIILCRGSCIHTTSFLNKEATFPNQVVVCNDNRLIQDIFKKALGQTVSLLRQLPDYPSPFNLRFFSDDSKATSQLAIEESVSPLLTARITNFSPDIQLLIDSIPQKARQKPLGYRIFKQDIVHDQKTVHFIIINFTSIPVMLDNKLQLHIQGILGQDDYGQPLEYKPDNCALAVFEYLGQLYIYSKDIPKPGKKPNSTPIDKRTVNFKNEQAICDNSRLEQIDKIAEKAAACFNALVSNKKRKKTTIEPFSVQCVRFSNSSLGCDTPGIAYKMHCVDGFIVSFQYNGKSYNLHTENGKFFKSNDIDIPENFKY